MRYRNILPVTAAFTANGTSNGIVQVAQTKGFYVGASVRISSNTQPPLIVKISKILPPNQIYVEYIENSNFVNLSNYLVADAATISLYEQPLPAVKGDDIAQDVYERQPVSAIRSVLVDESGRFWNNNNPIPVSVQSGNIQIGQVNAELEVQLSHLDNFPDPGDVHDSVRIGDGVGTVTTTNNPHISKRSLDVMQINRLVRREFNEIEITAKNTDGDPTQIVFRQGTNIVATMTLVYDSDGDLQKVTVV